MDELRNVDVRQWLNRERWERIKELFREAHALPPEEREPFLSRASEDQALQDHVRSLLAADADLQGTGRRGWMEPELTQAKDLVGRSLGHFRIDELLGSGGMGVVYRAHDTRLERTVALKLVRDQSLDRVARDRLVREARHASAVDHPNICTIFEIGNFDGDSFIAMEYVDGQPLNAIVAGGGLPVARAVEYGRQLAGALAHAHDRGILHRDLKSANIAIARDGRLKVLDFGISRRFQKLEDRRVSATAMTVDSAAPSTLGNMAVAGTLAYMAPEVLRGETADMRSDIWALGVVLHELITGRVPFTGRTDFELTAAILLEPPALLPPEIPPSVASVVTRCLRKDRRERYQHASEITHDLDAAQRAVGGESKDLHRRQQEASIAVLYFENLGGAEGQEYLRDGLTEDITTELSKIQKLQVFPRSAVMSYRDKQVTVRKIARQLNASHVLAGSLRQSGTRVRVSAQLIASATGHTVWAERYDHEMQDVFALQDRIAGSIAHALSIKLSPQEEEAITPKTIKNPRAYDCYLRGRRLFRRGTKTDMQSAAEMFEDAIALDPDFVLAYAALGHVCGRMHRYYDQSPHWMDKGIDACERAMRVDAHLPEALSARAFLFYAHEQYDLAIQYARMALERKHDCDGAYFALGMALFMTNRLEEAAALAERAIEVSGDDYNVYMAFNNTFKKLGEREKEVRVRSQHIRILQWHLEWAPENVRARVLLACCYAALGDSEKATVEVQAAVAAAPSDASTLMNAACAYASLGQKNQALSLLKRAVKNGYWHFDLIARDPDFTILHDEPEFQVLIETQNRGSV